MLTVADLQSSRRRNRGSSRASKPIGPNVTDLCLAKQTPFLHSQILTLTVCTPLRLC